MSMENELNCPYVKSKLIRAKPRGRKRRIECIKPRNKVNGIKVLSHTNQSITVEMIFHYKGVLKPKKQTVTFPTPDPKKLFQRIKNNHPAWNHKKCKKMMKRKIRNIVERKIKQQWRSNKPFVDSIDLESEIEMK